MKFEAGEKQLEKKHFSFFEFQKSRFLVSRPNDLKALYYKVYTVQSSKPKGVFSQSRKRSQFSVVESKKEQRSLGEGRSFTGTLPGLKESEGSGQKAKSRGDLCLPSKMESARAVSLIEQNSPILPRQAQWG